jgi:hypothetical protein
VAPTAANSNHRYFIGLILAFGMAAFGSLVQGADARIPLGDWLRWGGKCPAVWPQQPDPMAKFPVGNHSHQSACGKSRLPSA